MVAFIEVLCVLGNDSNGPCSQLGTGRCLGYILHLNFMGGIKMGRNGLDWWFFIESGRIHKFDCILLLKDIGVVKRINLIK